MKRKNTLIVLVLLMFTITISKGQQPDSLQPDYINSAEKMLNKNKGLGIGGYGEVHFNQPLNENIRDAATLDVHRLVMFLGYNFTKNTQFVSEIEFEHANEIWIEQAFIQHKLHKYVNLRAGLLLVPMGIVNEYHEPTTFNGVERPFIDNRILPTTWREIGAGFSGTILPISTRYQAYVVNGLSGYGTGGLFTGAKALREGRQKGSNAYMTSPAFTGKVEYFGISKLSIGLSGYFGNSQSKLLQGIHKDSLALQSRADSSVIGISMLGADFRFQYKGLELRGQFYYAALSNTLSYNHFTAKNGIPNDLGSAIQGFYAEAGYNVLRHFKTSRSELIPFIRYEMANLHQQVEEPLLVNKALNTTHITSGLTWLVTKNAVFKADIQFSKSEADSKFTKIMNAGIGFMF